MRVIVWTVSVAASSYGPMGKASTPQNVYHPSNFIKGNYSTSSLHYPHPHSKQMNMAKVSKCLFNKFILIKKLNQVCKPNRTFSSGLQYYAQRFHCSPFPILHRNWEVNRSHRCRRMHHNLVKEEVRCLSVIIYLFHVPKFNIND